MRILHHCMLIMMLLATVASAADQKAVKVRVKETGQTKYFDPNDPPADMPKLNPPEAAVAVSAFSCAAQMRVLIVDEITNGGICSATASIEAVEISLGLDVTIWLPRNPSRKLRIHEDGHKQISKHFFAKGAETAERLAQPYIGRKITGQASTCAEAVDEAIKASIKELAGKYMAEIEAPAGEAQEIYDEITDHGRNAVKESDAIEQAIERVGSENASN